MRTQVSRNEDSVYSQRSLCPPLAQLWSVQEGRKEHAEFQKGLGMLGTRKLANGEQVAAGM